MRRRASRDFYARSLKRRPGQKPRTLRSILEMYQCPVWEDVLGGKPLETDTSHPRRGPNDSDTRREEHGMLSVEEGALLVKTARVAVEIHLSGKETQGAAEPSPNLREERGVFVTLLDHANRRNLRGCIGRQGVAV